MVIFWGMSSARHVAWRMGFSVMGTKGVGACMSFKEA